MAKTGLKALKEQWEHYNKVQCININNCVSNTVLMAAIYYNQLEVVKFLLAKVTTVNFVSIKCDFHNQCHSPLSLALRLGHTAVCRELLQSGADVNFGTTIDNTDLTFAGLMGHYSTIRCLMNVIGDNGVLTSKALIGACDKGHLPLVRLLLKHSAKNPKWGSHKDSIKQHALCRAATKNHLEVVKFLLSESAGLNKDRMQFREPLWLASINGYNEVCEELLRADGDVNFALEVPISCECVLIDAIESRLYAIIQCLLQVLACNLNCKVKFKHLFAAAAATTAAHRDVDIIPLLFLKHMVSFDHIMPVSDMKLKARSMKILLQKMEADSEPQTEPSSAAILFESAAIDGLEVTTSVFLQYGVSVDARDNDSLETVLHRTIKVSENFGVVKLLISYGADMDAKMLHSRRRFI